MPTAVDGVLAAQIPWTVLVTSADLHAALTGTGTVRLPVEQIATLQRVHAER